MTETPWACGKAVLLLAIFSLKLACQPCCSTSSIRTGLTLQPLLTLSLPEQDAEEEAAAAKGGKERTHKAGGEKEGEDSGDDLDLDEYMRVLADEDKDSEKDA